MKKPKVESFKVSGDSKVSIHNVGHGPHETTAAFDKLHQYGLALSEKNKKSTEQRRQAGRKPKRKQAIYDFLKATYQENPGLSNEQRFRWIKRNYPAHSPYQIGSYNVYHADNRLWQEQEDAKTESVKNIKRIKYSTFRSYLTEIRKELKKAAK